MILVGRVAPLADISYLYYRVNHHYIFPFTLWTKRSKLPKEETWAHKIWDLFLTLPHPHCVTPWPLWASVVSHVKWTWKTLSWVWGRWSDIVEVNTLMSIGYYSIKFSKVWKVNTEMAITNLQFCLPAGTDSRCTTGSKLGESWRPAYHHRPHHHHLFLSLLCARAKFHTASHWIFKIASWDRC